MHIGCSSHPTVERVLPIESDFYFCFIGINQIGWNKKLPTLIFCIATYLTKVTQPFLPIKCFLWVLPLPLPCQGPEPWPRPPPLLEVKESEGKSSAGTYCWVLEASTGSSFSTTILDKLEKATFRLGSSVPVRSCSFVEAYVEDSPTKKVTTLRSSLWFFLMPISVG